MLSVSPSYELAVVVASRRVCQCFSVLVREFVIHRRYFACNNPRKSRLEQRLQMRQH